MVRFIYLSNPCQLQPCRRIVSDHRWARGTPTVRRFDAMQGMRLHPYDHQLHNRLYQHTHTREYRCTLAGPAVSSGASFISCNERACIIKCTEASDRLFIIFHHTPLQPTARPGTERGVKKQWEQTVMQKTTHSTVEKRGEIKSKRTCPLPTMGTINQSTWQCTARALYVRFVLSSRVLSLSDGILSITKHTLRTSLLTIFKLAPYGLAPGRGRRDAHFGSNNWLPVAGAGHGK